VRHPGRAAAAADRSRARRGDAAARYADRRVARAGVGPRQPGCRAGRARRGGRRNIDRGARVCAGRGSRTEGPDDPVARNRPALGGACRHRRVRRVLYGRRAAGGRGGVPRKAGAAVSDRRRMIVRAITIDFWGTLLLDGPRSDDRYKLQRLKDFETILAAAGTRASRGALERAYEASAAHLGRIWAARRDVSVQDHVRAIVGGIDRDLPARLHDDVLAALVDAYARPILVVPPMVDDGALDALRKLRDLGYT